MEAVLRIARKYDMDSLLSESVAFVQDNQPFDTDADVGGAWHVLHWLAIADELGMEDLLSTCITTCTVPSAGSRALQHWHKDAVNTLRSTTYLRQLKRSTTAKLLQAIVPPRTG